MLLAAISAAAGLALELLGDQLKGHWSGSSLEALGSSLISIGILSMLYELFLRRQIQDELYRMVNLERSLAVSQIKGGQELATVDWEEVLGTSSSFRCLLIEPSSWIVQNWGKVQRAFSQHPASFQLLIPDPNADYIRALAERLEIDEEDYRAHLRDAANSVEERWKQLKDDGALRIGSSVEVRFLSQAPSYSLMVCGTTAVVSIGRALKRVGREDDFAIIFQGSLGDFPNKWFEDQLLNERGGNIRFQDRQVA